MSELYRGSGVSAVRFRTAMLPEIDLAQLPTEAAAAVRLYMAGFACVYGVRRVHHPDINGNFDKSADYGRDREFTWQLYHNIRRGEDICLGPYAFHGEDSLKVFLTKGDAASNVGIWTPREGAELHVEQIAPYHEGIAYLFDGYAMLEAAGLLQTAGS